MADGAAIEFRRESAELGGEDRIVAIHDRRLQPFEQRRVALAEQSQRPAAHVEIVVDGLFDDVAPVLDREIPVAPARLPASLPIPFRLLDGRRGSARRSRPEFTVAAVPPPSTCKAPPLLSRLWHREYRYGGK